jgi:hypothetical protein
MAVKTVSTLSWLRCRAATEEPAAPDLAGDLERRRRQQHCVQPWQRVLRTGPGVVKPRDPILAGRDRPAGPPTDRVIPTDLGHGRPPASSRGAGMRAANSGATSVQERAQRVPVDAGAGGELQGESRRSRQASTSEVAQGQVAHP